MDTVGTEQKVASINLGEVLGRGVSTLMSRIGPSTVVVASQCVTTGRTLSKPSLWIWGHALKSIPLKELTITTATYALGVVLLLGIVDGLLTPSS
jgi:hypothetical protein